MNKLIYVMDVHCGWCYGNNDNIIKVKNHFKNKIDFELLVGGMWLGQNAPKGGDGFNQFIQNHSPQMEATTGAYVDLKFFELTKDSTYTFSSLEPSCAIKLVKEIVPSKTVAFAKEVQKAIFTEGKRLDKKENYFPIFQKLEIDSSNFKNNWMSNENIKRTIQEFEMAQQIARGFPTLALQTNNDTQILASGYFKSDTIIKNINAILTYKN